MKELEAKGASSRDVYLCDGGSEGPLPDTEMAGKKRVRSVAKRPRASLVTGRGLTRSSPRWVRVASLYIAPGLRAKPMSVFAHTARRAVAGWDASRVHALR